MKKQKRKTMSIRMDEENYEFLSEMSKEERSDLSKVVRDLVTRGRILLAVERYKTGEASLGKAAELAGLPVGQMMTILTEFGVENRKTICRDSRIFKKSGDAKLGRAEAKLAAHFFSQACESATLISRGVFGRRSSCRNLGLC